MISQDLLITFSVDLEGQLSVDYKLDPSQLEIPQDEGAPRNLGLLALAVSDVVYKWMKENFRGR
jgi:hypothetical protein